MTPAERKRKWDRLRKLAATTTFDGIAPNFDTIEKAAGHARMKLRNKMREINDLETDLRRDLQGKGGATVTEAAP